MVCAMCKILYWAVLRAVGIELIFFSIAAVFWIWHKKTVDSTDVFSSCCDIKDFSQLLMSG